MSAAINAHARVPSHGLRPKTKIQILTIAGTRDEVHHLGDSYCQDGFKIVRIEIKEVER